MENYNEWKVTHKIEKDTLSYAVYRLRDPKEQDNEDNREYLNVSGRVWVETMDIANAKADEANANIVKSKALVDEKLKRYSDISFGLDLINQDKQALIDSILTPEIKEKLAEIDAEFDEKSKDLRDEQTQLETEIKAATLVVGQTIKGDHHQLVWSKGRTNWDDKKLSGYASVHPEIKAFRSFGSPSVSVRKV